MDLTVITLQGQVTFQELRDAVRQVWETASETRSFLWRGEQGATLAVLTRDQIAEIATMGARYPERLKERAGGKVCLVASEDVDFGLARMLQSIRSTAGQELTYEIRVFRTEAEARDWIRSG